MRYMIDSSTKMKTENDEKRYVTIINRHRRQKNIIPIAKLHVQK